MSTSAGSTAYPQHVLDEARAAIADSLAVPLSEVTATSSLVADLGADSLDFVDIIFTLERKFGINVRDTELSFLSRLDFSSPEVMQNGYLTEPVVAQLATWLPAIATSASAAGAERAQVTPRALFSLITVESICLIVHRQLTGRQA